MIKGSRLNLRPIQEKDWEVIERWGQDRLAMWGPFQRFQLDHIPLLRQAFQKTGLLSRESGWFLIETCEDQRVVGFVRYTLIPFPDSDAPQPEIGFGLPDFPAQGKGYATEAVRLLVDYLFSGYPSERISAFTDSENLPAQKLMEGLGFQREGTIRRSLFRDAEWRDVEIYGLLRQDWKLIVDK